jgi:Na+-driven multidrug efflux pump
MLKLFPSLGALGPWVAATSSMTLVGLANRWRFNSNRWMNIDLFKRHVPALPVATDAVVE